MGGKRGAGVTRRGLLSSGSAAGAATLARLSPVLAGQPPAGRKTETCDVVIIGSGMAGLCAALEATASGARTVVLEKMPSDRGGGNSRVAGGLITVPSGPAPAARQDYVDDLDRKTLRRGNVALFKLLADHALDDVAWLQEQGAELLAPRRSRPIARMPFDYIGGCMLTKCLVMGRIAGRLAAAERS